MTDLLKCSNPTNLTIHELEVQHEIIDCTKTKLNIQIQVWKQKRKHYSTHRIKRVHRLLRVLKCTYHILLTLDEERNLGDE